MDRSDKRIAGASQRKAINASDGGKGIKNSNKMEAIEEMTTEALPGWRDELSPRVRFGEHNPADLRYQAFIVPRLNFAPPGSSHYFAGQAQPSTTTITQRRFA